MRYLNMTHAVRLAAIATVAALAAACVNDRIVYRGDGQQFTQPPAAAQSFVGYSSTTDKKTVCGNCHVDQQTNWSQTAHAKAWADLQASGHASSSCEACHTVSKLGNAATADSVGYVATKDARYHDVQCESCHGAGLQHVTAPGLSNRPLATLAVDTGAAFGTGCGECHTGTHEPFVDEWKASAHGNPARAPAVSNYVSGSNTTCVGCHTAQGALAAWGINTNYLEKDQMTTKPLGVTCAVCHDPHTAQNGKQLRFPVDVPDESQNLCMKCHHRRANPDPTSSSGPHSPEGPTLLGYAGWWAPNLVISSPDTIVATHGTTTNPKLCATCHVSRFTVNDPKTGNFAFQATGHKFVAIPCLDPTTGIPTAGDCDISQRTFKACTGSGCHGSEASARSAMVAAESDAALLIDQLTTLTTKVKAALPSEINTKDGKITTLEGSIFNLALAKATGAVEHNPFLIKALLAGSIRQMQTDYATQLGAAASMSPAVSAAMSRAITQLQSLKH